MTTPITNSDIWSEVIQMRSEIRSLLTEIAVIRSRNVGTDSIHSDHESRLRKLESGLIQVRALAAGISAVAGTVSGIITALLAHAH